MHRHPLFYLLLVATQLLSHHLHAQITTGQEMVRLSSREPIHQLSLNTTVATTITFPAPITLVTGYGMVLDAPRAQELIDSEKLTTSTLGQAPPIAPVTIVHYAQAATDTLVLRAVRKGSPCFLTVRCSGSIHLFQLNAAEEANLAVIVDDASRTSDQARPVQRKDILASRQKYSGSELVSILSKARQRVFLEVVNPDLYSSWQQRSSLTLTSQHGDLSSTITEIQRWPQKDAIILRSRVRNNSAITQYFSPTDVKVRIADRSYSVQLADSSGIVPPGKDTLLDLICQGDGTGSQEHLSIENDYRLEITPSTSPPQLSPLLEPNPLLPTVEAPQNAILIPAEDSIPSSPEPSSIPLPNFYSTSSSSSK